jgi:general secretion pathway protein D
MRRTFVVGAIVALCAGLSAFGQDPPAQPERKLTFNFRDASPDAVLQFVCRELKWTLVYATTGNKPPDGTITAWSDSQIGETKVVDFLNTALVKAKVQVFQYGGVLKVIGEDDAKKGTFNIDVGEDPTKVPINDTIRTWVLPLKNANVVDVKKELGNILDSEGVTSAINTYSNTVVMTGKSSSIYRIVRILKIIDVSAAEKLDVKMFKLKHADSQETARLLNEIFKREAVGNQQGGRNPFQQMMQQFMGGGGRGGGEQGPTAKTLASEVMRITSDERTNSVIATTTLENMKLIERLIGDLDKEAAQAIRLKLYPLRYADARETATVITSIFADEQTQTRQASRNQPRLPMFLGGGGQQQQDPTGASREVRAIADTRSNSVVVAANETNMKICDDLITNLDRQLTDVLRIKIYELKNADATAMTTVLRDIFRVQVTATQNAGRTQGGGGGGGQNNPFMQMFGQGGGGRGGNTAASGGLPPAQEVEITADARTNSVVVKASDEYIAIMDQVVIQLDQNPTEQYSTYVLPLSNANASDLASTLQNLLRGTGGGGANQNRNQQGTGLPGIGNQGTRNTGARTGSTQGGTQGGARTGGGGRNLGPLEGQDEPAPPMPSQDEEERRGVQGQVDVQADPQTNSLVIRTSPRNFESIRNIVQGLDRMRPQVLIKVLIAEVTLDDEFRFGVEWNWENKFHVNGDSITQAYKTDYNLFSQGGTATLTGDELGATLNAFAEDGRLKVMATPRILVLDNQSAEISIGKDVPRVTNSTINAQGNPQNTIQYRTVGILLSVTPHINFDGLVTMQVHPEISDRAPESESVQITEGVTSPTFNVNYADTVVAARNGQTVVIGGLIRESEEDTVQKIPFLGDIPLIGALFSNTTKAKVRRELMIFLTPYVAFTSNQLEEIAELEKAKLKLLDWRDVEDEGDRWLKKLKR